MSPTTGKDFNFVFFIVFLFQFCKKWTGSQGGIRCVWVGWHWKFDDFVVRYKACRKLFWIEKTSFSFESGIDASVPDFLTPGG
jgi:hypothetical protein